MHKACECDRNIGLVDAFSNKKFIQRGVKMTMRSARFGLQNRRVNRQRRVMVNEAKNLLNHAADDDAITLLLLLLITTTMLSKTLCGAWDLVLASHFLYFVPTRFPGREMKRDWNQGGF